MHEIAPEDAHDPLVLVLDLGTSSLRAELCDAAARTLAGTMARKVHTPRVLPGGGVEFDASQLFEDLAALIDEVAAHPAAQAGRVAAVATASLAASLVGVDERGEAVTPLYIYADSRPAPQAAALRARLNEDAVQQRTGARFHPSYAPARLLWLRETEPEAFARAHHWLSLPDYVLLRATGVLRTSPSLASWLGLFNHAAFGWDNELLAEAGLTAEAFPPVSEEPVRALTSAFADRWPALARAAWYPGVGDGLASNAGSGCTGSERAALSLGTSGALRVLVEGPVERVPGGLWAYVAGGPSPPGAPSGSNGRGGSASGRVLVGGALNDAGSAVAFAEELLRLRTLPDAEATIAAAPPDGHRMTMLPFLTGERSPGWDAAMRGVIAGLTLDTEPVEVLQAMMEAVAYRFALVLRELREVAPGLREIVASGGGAASVAWLQILADVLGLPVSSIDEDEATSRGAAVLALEALGAGTPPPPAVKRTFAPRPETREVYARALARQEALYRAIAAWEHEA